MPTTTTNPWDTYAEEYIFWLAQRQSVAVAHGPIPTLLLDILGDVTNKHVLDAGCGEGFLARILHQRGAHVTGLDLSPRLIRRAREQNPDGQITYEVRDLADPQPEFANRFDAIGSYLVLNDVERYREFAATLHQVLKPGGRAVLAFNNPYSCVVRGHIEDYFASGSIGQYAGLTSQGIPARYYHRTLEDYLDAFIGAGFRLEKLADVPDKNDIDWVLPPEARFPRFMILAFQKP